MGNIRIYNYMCQNCFTPKAFNSQDVQIEHKCPNCGQEMEFWCIEEVDIETGKTVNNKTTTEDIDIKRIVTGKPTVTCPYCNSTNTTKITATSKVLNTALFGFLGTKRLRNYHCNDCKSDF